MENSFIHPFILSGGSGRRLWPVSRELKPKQFHPLTSKLSLFQETCQRLHGADFANPAVICNAAHQFFVLEQSREIDQELQQLVLEPIARNTAPAAAFAAMTAQMMAPETAEPIILLVPSDHAIPDADAFQDTIRQAVPAAKAGHIVTFGIKPTHPETGYGYIKAGTPLPEAAPAVAVAAFTEKPDMERASFYAAQGDYYWNAGIFLFRADVFLDELLRQQPEIARQCRQAFDQASRTDKVLEPAREPLETCQSLSIDYAVMEHTQRAAMVAADFGWSDVGNWTALAANTNPDTAGTVTIGDVLSHDTKDSYLRSDGPLLTAIGLDNMIVVATDDAVLVAHKDQAQDVEKFTQQIKQAGRTEHAAHKRVFRPWGWYEDLSIGPTYRVKRLSVDPGEQLSLQYHLHRCEHWVVVSGEGEVTIDGTTRRLSANESVLVPQEAHHRLYNPGTEPLALIEVQFGSYVGEDDIVRLEDRYGRASKKSA